MPSLSFLPMQGALLKFVIFFSISLNFVNAVEIPTLYSKDKSWLYNVCTYLIKDLESIKDPTDIDAIYVAMKASLIGRMLPHLDEKSREYKVLLDRKNKKIGNQGDLETAITRYEGQLEYLAYELKKLGFSEVWKTSLSNVKNIDLILTRFQYLRNASGEIEFNSAGIGVLKQEPSASTLELLMKSIHKRIKEKHSGNVKAFYDRTLSKLYTNRKLLYLLYGRENFKF